LPFGQASSEPLSGSGAESASAAPSTDPAGQDGGWLLRVALVLLAAGLGVIAVALAVAFGKRRRTS
jgi:hypothetical protein